jgi:thiosulfate dehydrogenase [quinone] large subunit
VAGVGVAGLVVAGAAAGIGRAVGGAKPLQQAVQLSPTKPSQTTTTTTSGSGTSPSTTTPTHPPGHAIGPARDVPVGSAAAFTDPTTRTPSLVIQLTKGQFVGYDAICPHAGCTVSFVASQQIIVCPCHGSEFNPDNGDVVQGPAPRGLNRLTVAEGSDGQLYVEG